MAKDTRWDRNLSVTPDAEGLIGHAGAVLLRKLADQCGLTSALGAALARAGKFPLIDRGMTLVSMAVAIALGATSMNDIIVLAHQEPVFGAAPSDTTVRRTLELADPATLDKIARARAAVRAHVWSLICARPAGFPWLAIAGKVLAGWLVIDLDATLITAHSDKEGAAPTWKKGFGFHPLGAWAANTRECLAMLLRPGNTGSNTFTDHKEVLAAAIRQLPARFRRLLLIRIDGAGASHELIKHLLSLSSVRRTVLFTCGWMITAADEDAIGQVPEDAWKPGISQDGTAEADKDVAEITHLMSRAANWPGRPAVDRPPGQTVPPPPGEPHRLREEDRLEVLNHLHEHPRRRDLRRPRQPSPAVHRRRAPRARHRGDRRRAHREVDGPAQFALEDLGSELRLGTGRQPRRRPGRLVPAARPVRLRRPQGRRAGHAALPALEPARPAGPPRPEARPQAQPDLALEGRLPGLRTGAVGSRCPPEHIGRDRHPPETREPDTTAENRHNANSNQPRPAPE
jgi:Transposase DDE domain group 1